MVTVASIAHHRGDESVLEGNPEATYEPQRTYGNSKLANLLFARELHRRSEAAGSKLISAAAHPGVSATNLVGSPDGMGSNPIIRKTAPYFMPVIFQSSAAGANPTLWAATYGEPGSYVGPQWLMESRGRLGEAKLSRHARNDELARQLWDALRGEDRRDLRPDRLTRPGRHDRQRRSTSSLAMPSGGRGRASWRRSPSGGCCRRRR